MNLMIHCTIQNITSPIQNLYLDSTTMFCHWIVQHTQIVSLQSKVDTSIKKVPVPSIQKSNYEKIWQPQDSKVKEYKQY